MADLDRFLSYLQREDVGEVVLQSGKVAALRLTTGKLHPLTKSPLGSAHIATLLDGIGWASSMPREDTAGRVETLSASGQSFSCRIARRGDQLQVRISPVESAPAKPAPRSAPAKPAPRSAPPSSTEAAIASALASVEDVRKESSPSRPSSPQTSAPPRSTASRPRPRAAGDAFVGRPPRFTWTRGTPADRILALLTEARESGCTDVHVVGGQPARLRRLGALETVGDALPEASVHQMLMPLLEQVGASACRQLEELSYADFALDLKSAGRMRVNFAKGQKGLKGCFRMVLDAPPTIEGLGLPPELTKVAHHHQGLAVVSGPSGQGKTTTLAALVDLVNRTKPHHIITVEDPIEIIHPIRKAVISQRQVGLHTASFHRALKGALREDPDVIVIGELRDRETVEMALQAAETGHLVIASMSTPSGAKTIDRLIDMFPPDDQAQVRSTLAGALKVVISQRLVPTADRSKLVAAAELITGNIPLWSLIRDNKLFQLTSLLQRGRNYGMIRIEDSLNELLAAGTIDEDTARAYAEDPRAIHAGGQAPPSATAEAMGPPKDLGKAALGAMRNMFGRKKGDS